MDISPPTTSAWKRHARLLDILQSIPVLSFLPGVMLAMVSLFPSRQLGVEFGSIVLIFTGQVWNMAFSFYASLKALPRELVEASRVYRFGSLQRFLQLELPQGAIGLVWNSMVSVAGGWFFLMACEMFVLGKRDFRLPGLGSYLQSAASAGDTAAIIWGIAAMIGVVVLDRSTGLASRYRMVRQIQTGASGEFRRALFAGAQPTAQIAVADAVARRCNSASHGAHVFVLRATGHRKRNRSRPTGKKR